MAVAVLGMRGTGNFTANVERPKNWRQGILLLFPNGDAPLTAILSKLREQPTDDPEYSWFEKGLPVQRMDVIGASIVLNAVPADGVDVAGADTTTNPQAAIKVRPIGGSSGDTTILKPGHILRNEEKNENYLVLKKANAGGIDYVIVRRNIGTTYVEGGASTLPAITGDTSTALSDHLTIVGSGFPEGAPIGTAIAYAPAKYSNFSQIFRTPLFLTRTARKTRLRWDTSGAYAEAKREALQLHALEMERAFFFGEKSENTSLPNPDDPLTVISSGQPLRTTRGILNWLPTITTTSISVHTDLNAFNSGILTEAIWDSFLEEAFRYGSREKAAFCGSTAMNVLTQLAKNKSTIEAVPTDQTYGMAMMRYLTPFGTVYLINHPLLSDNPNWRKDLYIVDVDKLTFRYVTDTVFLRNRQNPGDDASKDEFLTEAGLEMHFPGRSVDADSPNAAATPAAHARLATITTYGG